MGGAWFKLRSRPEPWRQISNEVPPEEHLQRAAPLQFESREAQADPPRGGTGAMAELNYSVTTEKRQNRQSTQKKTSGSQVILEKVLGITTVSSSGLTSDPNTGLIAYPAGSVVVLLHPLRNQQNHILNWSKKLFTAVAFSHDGKHLATGESGHRPCVRVWEVGGSQVAEVQSHKHRVSCVAFSSNSGYIVSVGYQHDMTVSVWDWRKGSIVASNKVSSGVLSVSFSQDSSYFVTAGNRHVKFWYLDASREQRVYGTVPLIGRSGLLNDHKTRVFCGVACGRGLMASNTYCVTSSGLLCLFNRVRYLEAWVDLKTSSASCLTVSEDFIFCGCADGVIRVFSPDRLQYLTTLQRPHLLGAEQGLQASVSDALYPPTLALTLDPCNQLLTCVYGDHSIYVWDVHDVHSVEKIYWARYHSSSVWSLEVYPERPYPSHAPLPASSFLSCSSDNTVRFWNAASHRNLCGDDLLRILNLGAAQQGEAVDGKPGVRVLAVSPDGQHLAVGDRSGDLRVFGLQFLDQLVKIEAHDLEVLCLEYSPASTGVRLLASAGRDRLIHVFDPDRNYSLLQTLNDHSASISAVRFTGESPEVHLVTCSVDKSINFQTAEQTADGPGFSRRHCVVEKTSLYDMDCSRTQAVVACQDRNIRVYGVDSGKLQRCLKGSTSDRGALLKVRMDPSGSFFATSCSNKNIEVFDYETGECVASLFGHSEAVTCLRFSWDCTRLVSASADSCIFVWKLDGHMTGNMRKILRPAHQQPGIRRETFIMAPCLLPQTEEEEEDEAEPQTPIRLDTPDEPFLLQSNGKMPLWFRKLQAQGRTPSVNQSEAEPYRPQGRWANSLVTCYTFSPNTIRNNQEEEEEDLRHQSLEHLLGHEEEEEPETVVELSSTFTVLGDGTCTGVDGRFSIDDAAIGQGAEPVWSTQLSPDSACSEGSVGSLDQQQDSDTDSMSQSSSAGSLSAEDEEDRNPSSLSEERFDTDLRSLQPPGEKPFLNPRLSISTRFLSRFQDRVRAWPARCRPWPARAPPSIPDGVAEESLGSSTSVKSDRSGAGSAVWTRTGRCRPVEGRTAVLQTDKTSHNVRTSSLDPAGEAPPVDLEPRLHLDAPPQTGNQQNLTVVSTAPQPNSEAPQVQSSSLQVEATPPQVPSQDRDRMGSAGSLEETLTHTFIQSPALLAPPTTCTESRVPPDPDSDVSADHFLLVPPSCTSSPFSEMPRPHEANTCQMGASMQGALLSPPTNHNREACRQQCHHAAAHLQQAAAHLQRVVHLYQQLGSSQHGALQEALSIVQAHLHSSAPSVLLQDSGTSRPLGKR
ncbi:WD repeat-containing protein 62 isoform X2 [Oryzias latipes]|uniref:WD repeat domain 62 n=1 Tax=Oryzias latipes TaxID=8090 RepID=H2N2P7_ORYLA|nr:WD repeat-containing protein 62 isoform X2 [Oryzias latipes]